MNAIVQANSAAPAAAGGGAPAEPRQYLTFMLGGETYAIGIQDIKGIIEYGALTEIPRVPAFIRGVINLRGAVVPVIDLRARFGKAATEVARRTCIVIIEVPVGEDAMQDVGVLVDAVNAVLEIPASEIEPPPAFGANIRTDFISGMGKINNKFIIILNVQNVLSVDEMATLTGVAGASDTAAN